jgi:RNA polymerase sigma-70 factor (ECF subfamily)
VENDSSETAELLARAACGDADAFADLFALHRALSRRAVALRLDRRVGARVDASDVVQETYLEALRRLPDDLRRRPLPFVLGPRWLARERVLGRHRQHLHAERRAATREAPPLPADASSCLVSGLPVAADGKRRRVQRVG